MKGTYVSTIATSVVLLVAGTFLRGGVTFHDAFCGSSRLRDLCENPFDNSDLGMCLVCATLIGGAEGYGATIQGAGQLPLSFQPNYGQAEAGYPFLTDGEGMTALLSGSRARLKLEAVDGAGASLAVELVGANREAQAEGMDALPGRVHYLLGNDPAKWITHVPTYRKVRFRDVYPGVDVDYYGTGKSIEHDFLVRPYADPSAIRMQFSGARGSSVDGEGNLHLAFNGREVVWKKPVVFQKAGKRTRTVEAAYRMEASGQVRFEIGPYAPELPLTIDPVISYSSYFGSVQANGTARVAADASGNLYMTGATVDNSFPVTPGAFSTRVTASPGNVTVTKISADGSSLVYSTHFGGISIDIGAGIAVDAAGGAYVAGLSFSDDFPVTAGAVQSKLLVGPSGDLDPGSCFVSKLSPDGSRLEFSTFLGGTSLDACTGVAVDGAGNAYVAGMTSSRDFPTSGSAAQARIGSSADAFVAKVSANGTRLAYSTFLGGNGWDGISGIAVDTQGIAHVAGCTSSSRGLTASADALQRAFGGSGGGSGVSCGDAFYARVSADGASIPYFTFLGGARDDAAFGVALDGSGSAYVAGYTLSENFPVTAGAYQTAFRGTSGGDVWNSGDAFVTKIHPSGALVYSTYFGGSHEDRALGVAVDAAGQAWITGSTLSPNFPVTQDAAQRTLGGVAAGQAVPSGDAFIAQLNGAGSAVMYSTYLGGSGNEMGIGIATDPSGNAYVGGITSSSNFPVSASAMQRAYGGGRADYLPAGDAFFTKIGSSSASGVSIASVSSAASYVGNGVAPGEIVVLTGIQIGPSALAVAQPSATAFPAVVSETRILFDGTPAPMIYASAGQSSGIVPYGVAARQTTDVVVEYRGARSAPVTVPVLAAKPAVFSANASGRGPGAILNQDFTLNTLANRALPGSVIQIFGTGDGMVAPQPVDGSLIAPPFPRTVLPVSVTVGGSPAALQYAGAAPGAVAGLTQINVNVPANAPSGELPVVVRVGSAESQAGITVAVR